MNWSRKQIWLIVGASAILQLLLCEGRADDQVEGSGSISPSAFEFRHKEPPILPPARVIDSTEFVVLGEGRSIFIERIQPPPGFQVPVRPAQVAPNPANSDTVEPLGSGISRGEAVPLSDLEDGFLPEIRFRFMRPSRTHSKPAISGEDPDKIPK